VVNSFVIWVLKLLKVGLNKIETEGSRFSGMAPRFDPKTGKPQATASMAVLPQPSA